MGNRTPQREKIQPDFGADFHTDSEAPICYRRRIYPGNGLHDVIFISSYLHDSTFRLDQVRLQRRTLRIPLNRARWELYRKLNELKSIRSELTITRVVSLKVELDEQLIGGDFYKRPKMIIRGLQCLTDQWENSDDDELILNLVFGKFRLRVADESSIRVLDLPT